MTLGCLSSDMDLLVKQSYLINNAEEASNRIRSLLADNTSLLADNALLLSDKEELNNKVVSLEAENNRLKEQLRLRNAEKFGKNNEKCVGEEIKGRAAKTITIKEHTRHIKARQGGRVNTDDLPERVIEYILPEEERICCGCKNRLNDIGTDVSEQLQVIPMVIYKEKHVRHKYTCAHCTKIVMAEKPAAPIPKALAGASLIAEVVTNKYQYHLPLYRQAKMFASNRVIIPENTLGNWVMQAGEALEKVGEALWQAVLSSKYLQVDETTIKVQKENKNGYLWGYYTNSMGKGLIAFDFALSRSGSVAEKRLENYNGLLHTDGYGGYNGLRNRKGIVGLSCLTHARRKFHDVYKITQKADGIALEFITRLQPVYELESKMREMSVSFRMRKNMRRKYALPILKELKSWLVKNRDKVPTNSKLGDAIRYFLDRYRYLLRYTEHGIAEIDTNLLENQMRPVACGRKNFLFVNNQDSGLISGFWYSLIGSAVLNKLNARLYINFLLTKVHEIRKQLIDPATLLPHTIDQMALLKFAEEQEAIARQVLNGT